MRGNMSNNRIRKEWIFKKLEEASIAAKEDSGGESQIWCGYMKQTDRGAHERAVMQLKLMEQQAPVCPK